MLRGAFPLSAPKDPNNASFFLLLLLHTSSPQIRRLFNVSPQTIYAGFDPTADSLHVGNLLVLIGLLHCQRGGHQAIALVGGATGTIGDPSGRSTERTGTLHGDGEQLRHNLASIRAQIERVFANHEEFIWPRDEARRQHAKEECALKPVQIVNNADWYEGLGLVDFIATMGRHFRMGAMLSRSSVQQRLQQPDGAAGSGG